MRTHERLVIEYLGLDEFLADLAKKILYGEMVTDKTIAQTFREAIFAAQDATAEEAETIDREMAEFSKDYESQQAADYLRRSSEYNQD